MHPKESEILKKKIEELIHKDHNKENEFCDRTSHTQKWVDFVVKSKKHKIAADKKR